MTSKSTRLSATVVSGHTFTVDTRYDLKDSKILGRGSYGVVTTAIDKLQHGKIAIKRIRPFANDEWDARHTLREIRLLKLLGPHPNIITLYDLSLFEDKTELYMMMELMDCDLHQIIQSKQSLSDMHHKCFAKQMLEGIKAMHDIGVFHRDLKPGNILVSKDCKLRITDFGLARFVDEATAIGENSLNPLTEYVVTRWYRCPELLLAPNRPYNEAIDMWAVGCILAELLRRKPLFPGKSHANQVQLIFEVVGYSSPASLGFEVSTEASSFLDKRCRSRGQSLSTVIPQGSPQAIQLINKLLAVDPVIRPTAHQALTFDYLKDAEILCDYEKQYLQRPPSTLFDFESEKYSLEQLKELIVGEVRLSAVSNQELRAKLGMPEEEPIPIEIIKKNDEVTPTAVINNTVPSDIPAVARGTISFNAVTNATAFAQAAAVAAQAAAATTQRRMSSSNNDIKANASVGANGNKYDFHNGPRDNEGRSLRRTSASEPCNSNNQNNVVNNTKTIDSSTTLNEQYLAREAQMDTNTTQRANVGSKILFSSASNNATTTPSNIAAIARDVDAVKIAKSSSSTTTNSNTAPRRLSEGNSLRQASTSEKADKLSQRSSTGGMQSERTSDRISDRTSERISERSSGAINGNAIAESQQSAPYGHVLSTVSRGPKTPSPRKMDVIMAKGAKAKKQSLESGANDDQATASSDNLTAANIDNSANGGGNTNSSSSFLKNRHFGFMRSATASSSRPISANDNSNSNSNNSSVRSSDGQSGQTAGLSSLLSQFSGRYQSLSSRAKSAAGTGPAAAVDRSGELITKPVALKPVRQLATTVPQTAV